MRHLTEEQQQATQARRERFKELVKQVSEMSEDQRQELADSMGDLVTCEGHTLSTINTCLIMMQRTNCTVVGGFRQWKSHGRSVMKGEHGIGIWIPKELSKKDLAELQSDPDATNTKPRFFMGTVFDITQTMEVAVTQSVTQSQAA